MILAIYLVSIIIFNLPPFFLWNQSLTTSRIAEILWMLLLMIIFFNLIKLKRLVISRKSQVLLWLSLIFFISQTLSVINVINLKAFIFRYEIVIFFYVFFLLSLFTIGNAKEIKNTVKILVISFLAPLIIQLAIYILPDLSQRLILPFIHLGSVELIRFNLLRNRVYLENFNFVIIPVLFYFIFNQKKIFYKIILLVYIALTVVTVFSSNFRTVFLSMVMTVIFSTVIFRNWVKYRVLFLFALLTIFLLGSGLSTNILTVNVIDRFLLQYPREDYQSIIGRFDSWKYSWEVAKSSPIFGVGLGNYYDYSSLSMQRSLYSTSNKYQKAGLLSAAEHPHNIFMGTLAESGIVGLVSFLALILYFVRCDVKTIFTSNQFSKTLIIGFWSLFFYSLLNPALGPRYTFLFWLFRALIVKTEEHKIT